MDKLEFQFFNPKGIESWSDMYDPCPDAVEIIINGEKLVDMLKKIEYPQALADKQPFLAGNYGHNTARSLYRDFTEALVEGSFCNEYGVEAFCCESCGIAGCWSIEIFVEEDENFFYWKNFSHNHRPWEYNLSFTFEKAQYLQEMEKLKNQALKEQ